jgi:hypothetical protein
MKIMTFLLCLFCHVSYAQVVVVVAQDSSIDVLNEQNIENIFLARTSYFPNGEKAYPFELRDPISRTTFYQNLSGKSLSQLNAYWTTLIFTGKGRPPKSIELEKDIDVLLSKNPGAITYLQSHQVTQNMKVVYRFP